MRPLLGLLVGGRSHGPVAGEADTSACRPDDRPCAAERTLATFFLRKPRKGFYLRRLTAHTSRLGRRVVPGIGRKTHLTLSRVLLRRLKARAAEGKGGVVAAEGRAAPFALASLERAAQRGRPRPPSSRDGKIVEALSYAKSS